MKREITTQNFQYIKKDRLVSGNADQLRVY